MNSCRSSVRSMLSPRLGAMLRAAFSGLSRPRVAETVRRLGRRCYRISGAWWVERGRADATTVPSCPVARESRDTREGGGAGCKGALRIGATFCRCQACSPHAPSSRERRAAGHMCDLTSPTSRLTRLGGHGVAAVMALIPTSHLPHCGPAAAASTFVVLAAGLCACHFIYLPGTRQTVCPQHHPPSPRSPYRVPAPASSPTTAPLPHCGPATSSTFITAVHHGHGSLPPRAEVLARLWPAPRQEHPVVAPTSIGSLRHRHRQEGDQH